MRTILLGLVVVTVTALAGADTAQWGDRFTRGMTVSFTGDQALRFRLRSEPLPDKGQGGPVLDLKLGPPFDLWVLDMAENRLPAEGARLLDPDGVEVTPRQPGHWRLDRPPLGYLTLEVPALGRSWRLWSAFHPFMVALEQPVKVRVGDRPGAAFLYPSREQVELTGPGEAQVSGGEWAAFLPWDLFDPSQPGVEIQGDTTLAPGQRLVLSAETYDPDGDIAHITWSLPGGRSVVGPKLDVPVTDFAAFSVGVTVEDAKGSSASDEVRISPPAPHEVEVPGMVMVQAEDFVAEGGGAVEVCDRGFNIGRMITKWDADHGHWLEWTFTIPAADEYALYARYGTTAAESRRSLTLDGTSPGAAWESLCFERTGGFGYAAEQWRVAMLGPPLKLGAGAHTLRLTNLGGGLALDYLALAPATTGRGE